MAANICQRLLTTRTNSPLDFYRIIPRELPHGSDFATAVATKLLGAKKVSSIADELWHLVYDQGRVRLPRVLHVHPELRDVGQSFRCVQLVLWDEAQRRLVSFREIRARDFQEAAPNLAAPSP